MKPRRPKSKLKPPWETDGRNYIPTDIIDCIQHEHWWREWFARRGDWTAWKAFLAALFALPMTEQQLGIYREHTGRADAPTTRAKEAWLICGRRAGKTRILSTVATWLACFHDFRAYLSPGEKASVMVIASDRKQARVALRYIRSLITNHPLLKQLVVRENAEGIELSCKTVIEVQTASFRSTRGYTVAAILADEVAFWRDDDGGSNPASEIFTALRPGMASLPGSLLMVATSPYAKRGVVYSTWKKHYGVDGSSRVLVWRAPTRSMNATISQDFIEAEIEADPSRAAAEYLAEFRSDIDTYISREVVEAAVVSSRFELARLSGNNYCSFVDPSGGSSDSMTIAVAHHDRATGRTILDAIRERRPPFSPEDVVLEFTALLRSYGISRLYGDRYAGEWPRERFRAAHGIVYEPSEKSKSDIYRDLLPLLNSGRIELLDNQRLISQISGLERRTARGGRDSIDHAPGAHDDIANAAAGAIIFAAEGSSQRIRISPGAMRRAMIPQTALGHILRSQRLRF
jgi:hypothetical protein